MMREERNKIDRLLESFYAGTTSPQEELELYCLLEGLPDAAPYHSDLQLLRALIVFLSVKRQWKMIRTKFSWKR